MCEQCCAETIMLNDEQHVLPDFYLVKATKDGGIMKANDYGLVKCNYPSFIFSDEPTVNPDPNDSFANIAIYDAWIEKLDRFSEQLFESATSLKDVALLVAGCYQMGYTDSDGNIEMWLFNHLAQFVRGK